MLGGVARDLIILKQRSRSNLVRSRSAEENPFSRIPFLHPASTPAPYRPLARSTEVPDTAKQKLGESVVEYRDHSAQEQDASLRRLRSNSHHLEAEPLAVWQYTNTHS